MEQKKIITEAINKKLLALNESKTDEFNMEEALEYCFDFVRTTAKSWIEAIIKANCVFSRLSARIKSSSTERSLEPPSYPKFIR